jgi:Domain of unknown function (DUF4037)
MAHATSVLDPQGWLTQTRRKCREPYPELLREKIIAANHRAIRGILSSYEAQIRKAAARGDLVSFNHRIAALVASYFDILFAVNRRLHPGEKWSLPWRKTFARRGRRAWRGSRRGAGICRQSDRGYATGDAIVGSAG